MMKIVVFILCLAYLCEGQRSLTVVGDEFRLNGEKVGCKRN